MANPGRILNIQTVYIDGTSILSMNVATLQYAGNLGMIVEATPNSTIGTALFQLVQVKSTSESLVAGNAVMWSAYPTFVVSAKVADAFRNTIAGVCPVGSSGITAGQYGYIQISGTCSGVTSDGLNQTAGAVAIMSATDQTITGIAAGGALTYIPLGVVTTTATGGAAGVKLSPPLNI